MSNQPQIPVEEIELLPHPLDAWRAALNALIAVAPGNSADIAYHLDDARTCTLFCRDFSAASQGEAILIDRLMLLGASKLMGNRLDAAKPNSDQVDAFGFTPHARLIGIDLSAAAVRARQTTGQPGTASPDVHEARTEPLASSCQASTAQAAQGQPTPASPSPQPDTARPESGHESAPQPAVGGSLARPSSDSSCQ